MRLRPALLATLALAVVLPSGAAAAVPASTIRTIAGGGSIAANTVPSTAPFPAPTSVALTGPTDVASNTIVSQVAIADGNRIFLVQDGAIRRIAGNGDAGCAGDDGPSTAATVTNPFGLLYDDAGLMFADSGCHRIRHIQLAGGPTTITRVAGNTIGFADGNALTAALFRYPADVEPVGFADLLIADSENHRVRKTSGANVTTVAGDPNGSLPSEPPFLDFATAADIGSPLEVSSSGGDEYLIASYYNGITGARVYRVTSDGKIQRVAGGGAQTADGQLATNTSLEYVPSVRALPDGGFLYLESRWNTTTFTTEWRIRRVRTDGTVVTIASGVGIPYGLERAREGLYFTHQDPDVVRLMPATEISYGPSGTVGSSSASFALASWDEDATFECAVDNAFAAPCDDRPSYAGLADGRHTLYVTGTAGGQSDFGSAPVREWFVDTTPPAAFSLLEPGDAAKVAERPTFSWQPTADGDTEGKAGLDRYEVWVGDAKVGEVAPAACGSTCTFTPVAALPDGPQTWEVRAIDGVGNTRASGRRNVTIAQAPVASLTIAPVRSLINRVVTFDASGSSDANGGIVRYEWDLDGDGSFEVDTGGESRTTRSYVTPATLTVAARVTDAGGLTGIATASLVITAPPPAGRPLGVSINDGARFTNDPGVTIFASWPLFASNALVSNDGGFADARTFALAEKIPWQLDSAGSERLPKTIYVRFSGGGITSETFQDDIILDQTAPRILAATLAPAASPARATTARRRSRRLRIRARDNVSGVATMQVTKSKRRPGRARRFRAVIAVPVPGKVWVRVRDNAKNWSRWRRAR